MSILKEICQSLDHKIECNYRHEPLGFPGCICVNLDLVKKAFLKGLKFTLFNPTLAYEFDEEFTFKNFDASKNEEYLISHDKISELAYILSKREGFPEGKDKYFWNEAIIRLTPRNWQIESGELLFTGYGDLDTILFLAYESNIGNLSEYTRAMFYIIDGDDIDYTVRYLSTQENLERLGLTKEGKNVVD